MTRISWKKVMVTVIYKERDPTKPENYKPICFFPQHYNLSSTMNNNRLYAKLDQDKCPDQAGFRTNPNNGPPYDVQSRCPERQRMENRHVGGSDRLQEGIRLNTT